jgi:hypothetical protein
MYLNKIFCTEYTLFKEWLPFIYFPFDSGVSDYSKRLEDRFCRPREEVKIFVITLHCRTRLEKIYLRFGCKSDHTDDVYVILR